MQFLPQWKQRALCGATVVGIFCLSLSPAAAWDYGNFGGAPLNVAPAPPDWHSYWTFPRREHRKHKHPPRQASVARERKVSGPLLIVVSLARQKATVFASDGEIATTPVSTGVPGHPTPSGVFSVIQKQVFHRSNLYSAAPMPYMQRITWSGIALHAGVLPGHPASHGCIRLPHDFAVKLYGMTKLGARVVVTNDAPSPSGIVHQALFQPSAPSEKVAEPEKPALVAATETASSVTPHSEMTGSGATETAPAGQPQPAAAPARKKGVVSVFISRKERKLYARYNFATLLEMPISIADPDKPIGTHVFTAMQTAEQGPELRWTVLTIPSITSERYARAHGGRDHKTDAAARASRTTLPSPSEALDRVTIPPEARAQIVDLLGPGASLIISDNGLSDETDSDTDFVVLTP